MEPKNYKLSLSWILEALMMVRRSPKTVFDFGQKWVRRTGKYLKKQTFFAPLRLHTLLKISCSEFILARFGAFWFLALKFWALYGTFLFFSLNKLKISKNKSIFFINKSCSEYAICIIQFHFQWPFRQFRPESAEKCHKECPEAKSELH